MGVSTTRPSRWCRQPGSAVTAASATAATASGPSSSGSSASTSPRVSSTSAMPGPISTALACCARSRNSSADEARIAPASGEGTPRTSASGSAIDTCGATFDGTTTCSFPAPERNAASAARVTAPSVSVLPPTTRIDPRDSLPPVGSGSRQRRSTCGVMSVESGWGRDIVLLGHGGVIGFGEVLDAVEAGEPEGPVGGQLVPGHRGVGDLLVPVDLQQLLLGQLLEDVPEDHAHGLVGDAQQPLAVVPQRLGGQQAAHPQRDVGPALPARRPVVELAQQLAAAGLVRGPGTNPLPGPPPRRPPRPPPPALR